MINAQTYYLPLEKLALALIMASKNLIHYFQAHTINILTEHPLKSLLKKFDMLIRVTQWVVEPKEYDI